MATFEGVTTGFLVGAFMIAGVWAFVENDRQPAWCPSADNPRRAEATAPPPDRRGPDPSVVERVPVAARRSPRPAAREAPRVATVVPLRAPAVERADRTTLPGGAGGRIAEAEAVAEPVTAGRDDRGRPSVVVAVGGGVETPLSSAAGDAAQWDVRLLVQPYEHLGLELGYAGTSSARVATSSVEALGTLSSGSGPGMGYYLLAGVGWRRFHSPLSVDIATIPVGAGLAYTRGRWRADTRLTLRLASERDLHTFGATAHIGRAF